MYVVALRILVTALCARGGVSVVIGNGTLPSQAVFVDLRNTSVLGTNGTFRTDAFAELFNPTATEPPFFQVFDPSFLDIIGPNASIRAIVSNPTFAFAHEGPVWLPDTDELTFASNGGSVLGRSDIDHNNIVSKISLKDVELAIQASNASAPAPVNVTVTTLDIPTTVQMTNGGTGPYHGDLLLITSGRGNLPPSIVRVNPQPPYNTTVLVDNFFGRQFNSLNDIKVHPTNGLIFFTDTSYGWLNHFRPEPLLPNQIYRLDPSTGQVRVVADGFIRPNGIAFSGDGQTAYVTDTSAAGGFLGINQTDPSTIYQFDVDPKGQSFTNRRVFAYIDTGIPDGVQVDTAGNVYSGCGEGVQVWNAEGTLLGKIVVGSTSGNMAFAGKGRLVVMAETSIYLAQIAAEGLPLATFG
ncbi:D-lactonohydrolase-like protein [Amylostereum chailletii]|nr:D-lactonohydrolase-like protein [Amylostereum chailletii]